MNTVYRDFNQLFLIEREGIDFVIRSVRRESPVLVIAPHGGRIEPGTSAIAGAIAGRDYSFYAFEGTKPSGNWVLHVSSNSYDEPVASAMLRHAAVVITIHGQDGHEEYLSLGGRHAELREEFSRKLRDAGFSVDPPGMKRFSALSSSNICNRGRSGRGVQAELSRGLRDGLVNDRGRLRAFSDAIRMALNSVVHE